MAQRALNAGVPNATNSHLTPQQNLIISPQTFAQRAYPFNEIHVWTNLTNFNINIPRYINDSQRCNKTDPTKRSNPNEAL